MQKVLNEISELNKHIQEYVQNEIELGTLRVAEKSSKIIANTIATLIVLMIIQIAVLLASIAVAIYLNEQLQSNWIGFILVGLCSILSACVVWLFRKRLLQLPIMNTIIQLLFNKVHE